VGREGLVDHSWLSAVEELPLNDTPSWALAPLAVIWLSLITRVCTVGEHSQIFSTTSLLLHGFVQPTTLDQRWSTVFCEARRGVEENKTGIRAAADVLDLLLLHRDDAVGSDISLQAVLGDKGITVCGALESGVQVACGIQEF